MEQYKQIMSSFTHDSSNVNKRVDHFKESVMSLVHSLSDRINRQGQNIDRQLESIEDSIAHQSAKHESLARDLEKKYKVMGSIIDMFTNRSYGMSNNANNEKADVTQR